MINSVYRLVEPRQIEINYEQIDLGGADVLIRPLYMSICNADQRYYQGTRSKSALQEKLPMALIHECVASVVYDPLGEFKAGDYVVPVPNTPVEKDDVVEENYLRSSMFRSSGYDGFMQDIVSIRRDRLVPLPQGARLEVASFTEVTSVCYHALDRFDKFSHSRRKRLGVWGDGTLGYILSLLLRYIYPDSEIYIFGTVKEKLSYFSFADGTFDVFDVPEDFYVDHAFECVGSAASASAINQIIDHINPRGTISIMGVSENPVPINTRMVLEKGLVIFGSSRSGYKDFKNTVEFIHNNPEIENYYLNLVDNVVDVRCVDDIHRAFSNDLNKNFGKTVMKWGI